MGFEVSGEESSESENDEDEEQEEEDLTYIAMKCLYGARLRSRRVAI
jgi:hypothetical protein